MISSLLVTLGAESGERDSVLRKLRSDERLTLGELRDVYLPLVLDTASLLEGQKFVEGLLRRPGVLQVDLVEAHFEGDELSSHRREVARTGSSHA